MNIEYISIGSFLFKIEKLVFLLISCRFFNLIFNSFAEHLYFLNMNLIAFTSLDLKSFWYFCMDTLLLRAHNS